jgi:hypothetical protein
VGYEHKHYLYRLCYSEKGSSSNGRTTSSELSWLSFQIGTNARTWSPTSHLVSAPYSATKHSLCGISPVSENFALSVSVSHFVGTRTAHRSALLGIGVGTPDTTHGHGYNDLNEVSSFLLLWSNSHGQPHIKQGVGLYDTGDIFSTGANVSQA